MIGEIINREISWLSFNHRVLQEADDRNVPPIERLRFLGIFSNNLDEFFKVRVASIRRMIDIGVNSKKATGDKPKKIMKQIQETVISLQKEFGEVYDRILKDLEKEKIFIINEKQIIDKQELFIRKYFRETLMPRLSILMLNDLDYFPDLKDKSIYLATKLDKKGKKKSTNYALIEIPTSLSRFIVLPNEGKAEYIILIDDVIRLCLDEIFRIFEYDNFEAYTVKLTRDAELDIDNDLSKSMLEKISRGITGRSKGDPVRFLYDDTVPADLLQFIVARLLFDTSDNLIGGGRYHNFKDFMKFPTLGRKDLEYEKMIPLEHKQLHGSHSTLDTIKKGDILLHYPYHSFNQYIQLLRQAVLDPDVKEIYHTIYRVADKSSVVDALIDAARNGKKVTVNIELQARFDEEANIFWARKLEEVGARVFFGIAGLKVHAKLGLISRKEKGRLVDYACVSTGNFHEGTARVYTDVMLLTANSKITNEVRKVFGLFENTYLNHTFNHFILSPLNIRRRLVSYIEKEIENAKAGKKAYILLKINSLVDTDMIEKLYQASNAGVKIKMIVRGICCLIPGVPGMSENIEAISIVDRFLEHSRIFVFCNGGKELYFISSADWMQRNLDSRIEVSCPIYDTKIQKELRDFIELEFKDNVKARIINVNQDNTYVKKGNAKPIRSQMEMYEYYKKRDQVY